MAAVDPPAPERPVAGIAWMVVTGFLFVGVTGTVKWVGDGVPPAQGAFLRYLLGLPLLLPMLGAFGRARREGALGAPVLRLFALRGAAHTGAVILWFYAMTRIPIAEVTAMGYLTPVLTAVGAVLLLGERMTPARAAAVAAALIGATLILRPGMRALDPGHLAMLGTSLGFAASYLILKRVSGLHPGVVVVMLSLTVTVMLAPFAALDWVTPTPGQLAQLFLVAVLATAGHYTMTLAFRAAPVTVVQPAVFLQLVWATILGALAFGEAVDPWVILGGTVIVAAASLVALSEGRRAARAR
ncbi:threonine/homoserine efflux transporter RhtA [Hasllibacter halocynthiae]|uniref:Threonine/homoserine efflux transporter RhtA n=1 Tax=Hasllibacter halocynthiae TaxID=595589 RepID=A0A2T0X6L4_9RHOB|nr:DMT family transporter [Hasllibacter halocynthiae]PRY94567.1 threonine/homoserine efflux transporter RhtA [Hasllibacter halocynthiae]